MIGLIFMQVCGGPCVRLSFICKSIQHLQAHLSTTVVLKYVVPDFSFALRSRFMYYYNVPTLLKVFTSWELLLLFLDVNYT